ncbi:hypothetical protein BGZ74_002211 [Mortierella antarctica]|nr:hypothetical protein BGZ74_002211 [Mortierella antarctica]
MRQVHNIIVLLLCLAAIRADQEKQQHQGHQSPPPSQQQPPQQVLSTPQQFTPPKPLNISPKELKEARTALQKILSDIPIQTVEPLVETPRAYCKAFTALCNIACDERLDTTEQPTVAGKRNKPSEIASAECANPDAKTVFQAQANVGGVTSSPTSPTSDFAANGLLDGLTNLPAVATFVNIIHIAQKVCYFVGFLKVLADDNSSPTPLPNPVGGGGGKSIFDTIKDWLPDLFGGKPKPDPLPIPIPPIIGPIVPIGLPTPTKDGGNMPPTSTGSAASPTPTNIKWFFGLFSETDEHGNIIGDDRVAGSPDQQQKLEGAAEDGDDAYRLVSHDGRVARIVRAQKRQAEKMGSVQEQGKHDL